MGIRLLGFTSLRDHDIDDYSSFKKALIIALSVNVLFADEIYVRNDTKEHSYGPHIL